MEAKLETNRSGQKTLVCYYVGDQYNEAIEAAERQLNPEGEPMPVIALPVGFGNDYKG